MASWKGLESIFLWPNRRTLPGLLAHIILRPEISGYSAALSAEGLSTTMFLVISENRHV
jgi:hypothetical protein